jgi:hypothetical protein
VHISLEEVLQTFVTAANNKKLSLKCALDMKMITQANTAILFLALTHPVNSGKDRK